MALAAVWKLLHSPWLLSHVYSNRRLICIKRLLAEMKPRKAGSTFTFLRHLILRKSDETRKFKFLKEN